MTDRQRIAIAVPCQITGWLWVMDLSVQFGMTSLFGLCLQTLLALGLLLGSFFLLMKTS